jgi:hypothetical protein
MRYIHRPFDSARGDQLNTLSDEEQMATKAMLVAEVWTVRDGQETLMEVYAEPPEALAAIGLAA